MAVVKYGSVVTEIKGKVGGWCFQKCGQSLSLRSNPSKFVSRSQRSFATRTKFSELASKWNQLTADNKLSYSLAANTYPTFDKWGNPLVLNGYQLFQYIHRTSQLVTGNIYNTAVAYANPCLAVLASFDISIAGDLFSITIEEELLPSHYLLFYTSQQLPPNSFRVPSEYKFFAFMSESDGVSINVYEQFVAALNTTPVVGNNFYILCKEIDITTGIAADSFDDIWVIA